MTSNFVADHYPGPPQALSRFIGSSLDLPRLVRNSTAASIVEAGIRERLTWGNDEVEATTDENFRVGDPIVEPAIHIAEFIGSQSMPEEAAHRVAA
jgi:hypothetical protein